jgi:transposase
MTSIEKREMIIQAREDGMKIEEIVRVYHVGRSTVYDLLNLAKETGDIRPRPHEYGRKPSLDQERMEELRHLLDERCDITLSEIIEEMKLEICISALSRIIRNKLNYHFKKRRYMPVSEIAQM